MNDVNVSVNKQSIVATTQGNTVAVAVNSGIGPQGAPGPAGATDYQQLTNKPTSFPPSAHAASHGAAGSDPITVTVAQVTGLQTALDGKQPTGSYVVTTDSRLSDAREWSAATVSQADAEAGSSTSRFAFTPQRVFQAIAAWWAGSAAKTKLDGIASGATANATDAQLRDRSTHTGTQTASTISDFTTAVVAAAPPTTNASLLTSGTLPDARLSGNIARTSDISSAVAAVVDAAPASLDTLKELAAALGNDASFSATVTNTLAAKAPINNPTFTGTVGGVTKAMVGLGNVPNVDATARANHTGSQEISTVSGLQTALDGKAASSHAHGSITADGKIGTAAGKVVVTGENGAIEAADYVQNALWLYDITEDNGVMFAIQDTDPVWSQGAIEAGTPDKLRLSIGAAATSHSHGSITSDGKLGTVSGKAVVTGDGGALEAADYVENAKYLYDDTNDYKIFSFQDTTPVWTGVALQNEVPQQFRDSIDAAATSHSHGSITADGKLGTTSGLPLITTTGGVITVGAFGTSAGQFCQGNDSRLSNARVPTAHKSTHATGGSDALSPSDIGASAVGHAHSAADISGLATVATSGSYTDLSNKPTIPAAYTLPTASATVLGGVKVGSGLSIDGSSVLSATYSYTLPAATTSTLGGVIVGSGLSVSSGTVSANVTSVAGRTGAVTIAAADVSGLGSLATQSSVAYSSLTGIPSTFAPAAHTQAWSTITSTPTTLSGYGITDGLTASSLASPPAIGGTTPAAGSFTVLAASTSLAVPSGASGTPAAGHVYRSADTLRYRDSTNTERLLLNSADNLANLGNTATARTNLGLGTAATAATSDFAAASHTHAASAITSGVIATARLGTGTADATTFLRGDGTFATPSASVTYATTAQAQDLTSSTVAMSPLRGRDQTLSWIRVIPKGTSTANGGSAQIFPGAETAAVACGSTANGLAKLYYAGPGSAYQFFHGRTAPNAADWTIPRSLWVRCYLAYSTTNGIARVIYGLTPYNSLGITGRAIGFEIRNLRLWMLAHNGSSLTATDTGQNVPNGTVSFDVLVRSDGAGGMSLLYNGTQIATSSGGPSTTDASNSAMLTYECTNGTDTASVGFNFSAAWISVA